MKHPTTDPRAGMSGCAVERSVCETVVGLFGAAGSRIVTSPFSACPGCGALVANVDGPVHTYVRSSAGCWRVFGEVQADESARFGYPPAHRLVVDAYMAQHPGDGRDRRDRQSVYVHLIALCAALEGEVAPPRVTQCRRAPTVTQPGQPFNQGPAGHFLMSKNYDQWYASERDW